MVCYASERLWTSGISIIAAMALAVSGTGAEWPDLSSVGIVVGGGELDAAVIIAVEDYPFLPDVEGATTVGSAWFSYLEKCKKVPFVLTLFNRDATRLKILKAVKEAGASVKEGGRLWIVFIGHGAASKDGTDGVLVGVTAQDNEIDFFPHTVARSEILMLASGCGTEPPVVVIDACFSGKDATGQSLLTGSQMVVNEALLRAERVSLLTAGRSGDIAGRLPGGSVPAFSYLVLGALMGWGDENGDGSVTATEAASYARRTLLRLDPGRLQEPQFSGEDLELANLGQTQKFPEPDLAEIQMSLAKGASALRGKLDELARVRAERERLELLEEKLAQEQAEALAREKFLHEAEVSDVWRDVLRLAGTGGQEGVDAINMFLEHYANHKHGNPKQAEATALLRKLHDQNSRARVEAKRIEIPGKEGPSTNPAVGIDGTLASRQSRDGPYGRSEWFGLLVGIADGLLLSDSGVHRTNWEILAAVQTNVEWFQWRVAEVGLSLEAPLGGFVGTGLGLSYWDLFIRAGADLYVGTGAFVDGRLRAAAGYRAWLSTHWQLEFEITTRHSLTGITTYGFGALVGYAF